MKITLTGTVVKTQEAVEVTIEFVGDNSWEFKGRGFDFVISDLVKVIHFLEVSNV